MIALEEAETEARTRADRQQLMRLALWRIDSALATVLSGENAIPPVDFRALSSMMPPTVAPSTSSRDTNDISVRPGEALVHFQYDPAGELTTVPTGPSLLAVPTPMSLSTEIGVDLQALVPALPLAQNDPLERQVHQPVDATERVTIPSRDALDALLPEDLPKPADLATDAMVWTRANRKVEEPVKEVQAPSVKPSGGKGQPEVASTKMAQARNDLRSRAQVVTNQMNYYNSNVVQDNNQRLDQQGQFGIPLQQMRGQMPMQQFMPSLPIGDNDLMQQQEDSQRLMQPARQTEQQAQPQASQQTAPSNLPQWRQPLQPAFQSGAQAGDMPDQSAAPYQQTADFGQRQSDQPMQTAGQTFNDNADSQLAGASFLNEGQLGHVQFALPTSNPYAFPSTEQGQRIAPVGQNDIVSVAPHPGATVMIPLWIDGQLVLVRRVTAQSGVFLQGSVLDWPGLREHLLREIADLLPEATLVPAKAEDAEDCTVAVSAALPIRLVPGAMTLPGIAPGGWSPLRVSLFVAWAGVGVAILAFGLLLVGLIRLSERRAAFVTAVTHELRTPLTTFQLYTELLADGMVAEEDRRQLYLDTLCGEASRLTHLVENVLAYARLERPRSGRRLQPVTIGSLLETTGRRLREDARRGGMDLTMPLDEGSMADEATSAIAQSRVTVNPSAVEQILVNLVDNSCRYAGKSELRRIDISAGIEDGFVAIRVRDYGPGVSSAAGKRLFRSFAKSAQEAAEEAPGVGLGLALSRRLARDMGGDLIFDATVSPGAGFELLLRRARDS